MILISFQNSITHRDKIKSYIIILDVSEKKSSRIDIYLSSAVAVSKIMINY